VSVLTVAPFRLKNSNANHSNDGDGLLSNLEKILDLLYV
jgi:hypothetical protein